MNYINIMLNDPTFQWIICLLVLALLFYWVALAIFETVDRQRVVKAAEAWAANKRIRHRRTQEGSDLWDSVNQLKRGQKEQKNGY